MSGIRSRKVKQSEKVRLQETPYRLVKRYKNKELETHRSHRWILNPCSEFLVLKELAILEHTIVLTWYMAESHVNFIFNGKIPKELDLGLLDGRGRILQHIRFSGVKKVSNDLSSMKFDYADSEIQTVKTVLSFKSVRTEKGHDPIVHEEETIIVREIAKQMRKFKFVNPHTGQVEARLA